MGVEEQLNLIIPEVKVSPLSDLPSILHTGTKEQIDAACLAVGIISNSSHTEGEKTEETNVCPGCGLKMNGKRCKHNGCNNSIAY